MSEMIETCLIVDDSPTIRRIENRILSSLGFDVFEAENGKEALDKCGMAMPDLILLDWNMPVMSGIDFLKAFRDSFPDQDPVVIFCTTCNDIPHIEAALEAGAREYIMKPFDEQIIREKLNDTGFQCA